MRCVDGSRAHREEESRARKVPRRPKPERGQRLWQHCIINKSQVTSPISVKNTNAITALHHRYAPRNKNSRKEAHPHNKVTNYFMDCK